MRNSNQDIRDEIDELNQSAWNKRVNDSPAAFRLSEEALALSNKIDYPRGKAEACRSYGFCLVRLSKNDEALTYLSEALTIFDSLKDLKGMAVVNEYLGIIQRNWGNFANSLQLLKKALALSQEAAFPEIEVTVLYQVGVTYKNLGNYEKALDNFNKCLAIARSIDDRLMEAYAINLIGAIYFEIESYVEALEYYQQGLALRLQSGDKWGEAGSLDNIGYTYFKLHDEKQAVTHCEKSLAISESTGDKRGQGNALFHLAEIYTERKDWDKAILLSGKSLQIWREAGDRRKEAELMMSTAVLKQFQDKGAQEVLGELEKALHISDEINAADLSAKAHWALYVSYKQQQNYSTSIFHLEKFNFIEKQMHKDAVNQKVLNFEISHRAEQSEKEAERFRIKNQELAKLNREIKNQKEEIEKTLSRLKAAQAQLIQSEKMASLGELTAGIAHEIQNPLNFVNNFSEVNSELIDELTDEVNKGNIEGIKAIAKDIRENEQKINHHGKRADAIVKNMLQHSRGNSSPKEPADINKLADEYLRLSYHGLRAKDEFFNAAIKTDFDESIVNINIVPQNIGRVLLNLYNNAFYAVSEKAKENLPGYAPIVSLNTQTKNGTLQIEVKDNGNGIPKQNMEKIFQPFFTTKPSGQGTGLGLSLAYDIIKVHGGELKVETEEGEGTKFIIILPAV